MPNTEQTLRYNTTAIAIHWMMAIMILCMIGLGFYMVGLEKGSAERSYFFALHKSIGLTLALLALFRLTWKIKFPPPTLPNTVQTLDKKMATMVHHFLYLMLFLQPISGYLSSSFSGYKTKLWSIALPNWGWKSPPLNSFFTDIHTVCAVLVITLIILHTAGVIKHLLSGETALIKRMWFG